MAHERKNLEQEEEAAGARQLGTFALTLSLTGVLTSLLWLLSLYGQVAPSVVSDHTPTLATIAFTTSAAALPMAFAAHVLASISIEREDRGRTARFLRRLGGGALVLLFLWWLAYTGIGLVANLPDVGSLSSGEVQILIIVVAMGSTIFFMIAASSLSWFIRARWQDIPPDAKPGATRALYSIVAATGVLLAFGLLLTVWF